MSITIDVICYKFTTLKNGESPLKLRITKNRKRKYLNIGISVNPIHWDFDKSQPKPTCPDKDYIEKIMSDRVSEYRTKILELKAENKEFTAHSLADIEGKANKHITVKELFEQHIEGLRCQRRYGYAASIQQVYNSLLKFNKHLNIYFSDIDIQWLKRYEVWLRKEGMSENTIGVRFRTLRTIYNLAIEEGAVKPDYYPFKKFKVSKLHKATIKRAISKEEIVKIINLPV
ncbi:site-specific integrase [Dysgonomonas sp. 216]|uniref:phage integrase SAM-like domain and Arm DNA-binding domain-containing protein n=1 Tax=Dysgonomonas sp. 216 TaxID=2302934 RepID=UPI0013D658A1|nr:phage integrase SAM-like domain and Arm DNA-binding domain-containing protein [Dysgonomonas sp. 216]NDW19206.1 site-specific integrase [Dysgonomonas sp. 216]